MGRIIISYPIEEAMEPEINEGKILYTERLKRLEGKEIGARRAKAPALKGKRRQLGKLLGKDG